MKEYLLSTNDFSEPAYYDGPKAYSLLMTRLLLLQPGTNPLHPKMGVGLGARYRYILDKDMPALENMIRDQITTYLPTIFNNTVEVYLSLKENTKYLLITIIADGTRYVYDTENSDTPIEVSNL